MSFQEPEYKVVVKDAIDKFSKDGNLDDLKSFLIEELKENGLVNINLVYIAKINSETAILVKELVSLNEVNNLDLVDQMAKEIVEDIENSIDRHLNRYQKYTLNAQTHSSSVVESTAQFFNLISLLKDVSLLGRKLFECAPQFNVQRRNQSGTSSPSQSDRRSINSSKSSSLRIHNTFEEDATSEDLLAALMESSSTDDFLILSSSLDSITLREMILAAYIYIKSHECFTLSHEIQGVVMVLRRVKFLILNILAPQNQMELIAKLLTSIGRYNEMAYVFDLFRDRDQFETLLSKGVEKTPELGIALFNYTKKNPEFYPLVTLNFSMFREIGESLEATASKRLRKLFTNSSNTLTTTTTTTTNNNKSFKPQHATTNTQPSSNFLNTFDSYSISISCRSSKGTIQPEVVENQSPASSSSLSTSNNDKSSSLSNKNSKEEESLNIILIELVDAADCFSKAGCYKKLNDCERKAKLVALQLALLPYEIIIINLQQNQLADVIVGFDSFADAYIVAEAYDYHGAWRLALYKNVILDGKLIYLEDFCKKCDLSPGLVEELVLLYKHNLYTSTSTITTTNTHNYTHTGISVTGGNTNSSHNSNNNNNKDDKILTTHTTTTTTTTSLLANNTNSSATTSGCNTMIMNESVIRSAKAMRALLSKLNNIELKCKFYTLLTFEDSKEELLQDPAVRAHLLDIKLA